MQKHSLKGIVGYLRFWRRLRLWKEKDQNNTNDALPDISESLPPGKDLPRKDRATLNRTRAKVAKTADNLVRWNLQARADCECGEPVQTIENVLRTCPLSTHCNDDDLREANNIAREWIMTWRDKLWWWYHHSKIKWAKTIRVRCMNSHI